ncbi:MAG: 30S ribosomal protein S13, partial [Proteobacteria bacterium]|nr:30S ribosomal protein S13 [Pseudomonadota bacterium]
MARIAGVDLPRGKRMEIALTYIYGIGRSSSRKILGEAEIDWNIKSDEITTEQLTGIR